MPQAKIKWQASYPQNTQKQCLLLLPKDVVLMIYEIVLVFANHIYPARQITTMPLFHPPRSKETTKPISIVANFLASCAQIHAEGAYEFYTKNTFYITDEAHDFVHEFGDGAPGLPFPTVGKYVPKFAPRYAPLVRKIRFQHHEGSPHNWDWSWELVTWIKEVKYWPNLRHLKLELAWEAWGVHYYQNDEVWKKEGGREEVVRRLVKMLRNVCTIHEVKPPKGLVVEPNLVMHGGGALQPSSDPNFGVLRDAVDTLNRGRR